MNILLVLLSLAHRPLHANPNHEHIWSILQVQLQVICKKNTANSARIHNKRAAAILLRLEILDVLLKSHISLWLERRESYLIKQVYLKSMRKSV